MANKQQKNFKYGDLWPGTAPNPGSATGRELVDPSDYINNRAFLNYISKNGFKVYFDYETAQIAYTTPQSKEIVINGNYPDSMVAPLLQHELGHLMLFNASQFVSVNSPTMRSMVSKVLYTPSNLKDYGLRKLLHAENVIEDIIIETVAEGSCVCHSTLEDSGVRAGVKHLDQLESATIIAREVCSNLMKQPLSLEDKILSYKGLGAHLQSMIQELRYDIEEIDQELLKVHQDRDYLNRRIYRRFSEISKVKAQVEKLKAKINKHPSEKLSVLLKKLEAKLRVLQSKERERYDSDEAEKERSKALAKLQKYRNNSSELLDLLLQELALVPEGDEQEDSEDAGISANRTDHLLPSGEEPSEGEEDLNTGHSYDCGLPHPVTIDRSESRKLQQEATDLKKLNANAGVRKIRLSEDDLQNIESNRKKLQESEFTYMRSSKKEWDNTDMLQGRKKKRGSGINVLVGLDISGSMNREWTEMFDSLSTMVEKLVDNLDIESVYYFTYDTQLVESSDSIEDLTLKAAGGNAFGYVYQDIMKQLPVMQKNEIILVTDCGDNLGFKLSDACVAERNGEEVMNHISIVDTEEAGFYDKSSIYEKEWSIHLASDPNLHHDLRRNMEKLIEA